MTSDERLKVYDKFLYAKQELGDVKEDLSKIADLNVVMELLDEIQHHVYKWWRIGDLK